MRVTSKGRFAVNAILDLALREGAGPVALASIAERQRISLSYLEQLFSRLKRAGIVDSTRGPGGGYTLGRRAAEISLADIVRAVDDPLDEAGAAEAASSPTRELWQRLGAAMLEQMGRISLSDLVDEQVARGVPVEPRPVRRANAQQQALRAPRTMVPNSVFAFGRSFTN